MNKERERSAETLRVALIDPPTGLFIREDRCQAPIPQIGVAEMRPPIELAYMAGAFQAVGCVCSMKDYPSEKLTWDDVRSDLAAFQPHFLVINTTVSTVHDDLKACAMAKEVCPGVMTIARGLYASVFAEELLKQHERLDVVACGEPEAIARQLAESKPLANIPGIAYRHQDTICVTRSAEWCQDLDVLPFPARNCMNLDLYRNAYTHERETSIQVARGCSSACMFCVASTVAGPVPRVRSYQSILKEISECVELYGIRSFFLRADTFTFDKAWVCGLCHALMQYKEKIRWVCNARVDTLDEEMVLLMKRAGCYAVSVGIESGNQRILDQAQKRISPLQVRGAVQLLRAHGMIAVGYFMIGFPGDTHETIRETMDLSTSLDLDAANFYIAYPFPGTVFYELCRQNGLLEKDPFFRLPYVEASVHTKYVSAAALERWRKKMVRHFYMRPLFIVRQLKKYGIKDRWRTILSFGIRVVRQGWS
jgi:anaerobic magnesium-protoporphyrin IX monomethyl ester cyclase